MYYLSLIFHSVPLTKAIKDFILLMSVNIQCKLQYSRSILDGD